MAPETPFGALDHNGRSGIQITSTRVGWPPHSLLRCRSTKPDTLMRCVGLDLAVTSDVRVGVEGMPAAMLKASNISPAPRTNARCPARNLRRSPMTSSSATNSSVSPSNCPGRETEPIGIRFAVQRIGHRPEFIVQGTMQAKHESLMSRVPIF